MKLENEMLILIIVSLAIIIGSSLLLAGCTTTKPIEVTAPCPKPNIPAEPRYPVQDLKQGDQPDKVMKAYVATVQGQQDYIHKQILPICTAYNGE
jgi:hypothetical protein